MDNPFKKLNQPLQDVPEELKERVMKDIATAKLLMDLAVLFSFNMGSVIERTVFERNNEKKNNK